MINPTYQGNAKMGPFSNPSPLQDCSLAAIDIGTNSIHMVIVKIEAALPALTIIAREKDTVRLGDRDPTTGKLTPAAMKRAFNALKRCQDLATSLNVEHIIAVATSATREAPNGKVFLQQIKDELGIEVNLISGQEEARRIYLGVLSGMEWHQQPHYIIDIGGGSTELILADSQDARFLSSTKVGAVRLTREFITTDPISDHEFLYLKAYIRGMLERPVDEMRQNCQPGESPQLVGTSGTIETLAGIHAIEKLGVIPSPLTGYRLPRKDLKALVEKLKTMTYEARFEFPGISDKRAEIIVAGAMILYEAMTMLKVDHLVVCERALREGMIVDWMLKHGFIESRLQYQSAVRQRSVRKIARKYHVNLESSQRIANFSEQLFNQLQDKLHHWGVKEQELLHSAAILHNCGVYISHDSHHKHSYYLIRYGELLGFTEREITIMAHLARYHRKSKPKKRHESYFSLAESDRQMVRELSAILRLAVALDRRQTGAIQSLHADYDLANQCLTLILTPTQTHDQCVLELWSLATKKLVFEEEFNVTVTATLDTSANATEPSPATV